VKFLESEFADRLLWYKLSLIRRVERTSHARLRRVGRRGPGQPGRGVAINVAVRTRYGSWAWIQF